MKKQIRHSTNIKDTPFLEQWIESIGIEMYELIRDNYNKEKNNG